MESKKKTALWIGRFQPFTNGHYSALEQIIGDSNIGKVIIGIGSSEKEWVRENPFSYYERKEMIDKVLKKKKIKYEIYPIPDVGDNLGWKKYILDNLPPFEIVFSGNPIVQECFKDSGKECRNLEIKHPVKASNVRVEISNGNFKNVPREVAKYLNNINARKRLEELIRNYELTSSSLKTPYLAVDAIIERGDKLLLIERKNPPYGFALPGGFVDYGESVEDAVVREVFEETNLRFEIKGMIGIYSKPNRDPRQHVVSLVYYGSGNGEIKAKSDAKNIKEIKISEIDNFDLVFDHRRIISDYMMMIKNNNEDNLK